MKKTMGFVALICVLVLSLSLVACAQEAKKPDPQGSDAKPKLIAVGEATFAPFEFVDEKTGKPTGFDVELIAAIGAAAGFDVEYKNIDWNSLIPALQNKEGDLIVSGMTVTDERLLEVAFSDPYFTSGQAWAVKDGSPVETVTDLAGKTVAVQINTTADFAVQKLDQTLKDGGKKGVTIKRLPNAADVFTELMAGGVDAVVSDLPVIQEYLKNNPESSIIVPEPAFTVEYYGIAMRKADKDTHELVNKGLAKIKADGTYDQLYDKYFGDK